MAFHFWHGSNRLINPRYWRGANCLSTHYRLLETDCAGIFRITDAGQDFVTHPEGATVQYIDFCEGQLHLLQLILDRGPGKGTDFLAAFTSFLRQYSVLRTSSTIATAWSDRMRDLVDRGPVARAGQAYQITHAGEVYLAQTDPLLRESW